MGNSSNTVGKIISRCYRRKDIIILLQGLHNAGKSTILYRMKYGEQITTLPFNPLTVETIQHKNIFLTTWEAGIRTHFRLLLKEYFPKTQAVIFVVDSNERKRINVVRDIMTDTVNEAVLEKCVFAVVANKQDLPDAMTLSELSEALKLHELFGEKRIYKLFGTSAIKGDGLYELFDWIANTLLDETSQSMQNISEETVGEIEKDNDKMDLLLKPFYKLKEFVWA